MGYGCVTCIGNSGPLPDEVSKGVNAADLAVVSVLSGNRNFEGRIQPDVKMNYLASPPLVVAYALAGRMDLDLTREPLGTDADGEPVFLHDIWPSPHEVQEVIDTCVAAEMFTGRYADVFSGDHRWQSLETPVGRRLRVGRRIDLRAQASLLRRDAGRPDAGDRRGGSARAGQARRLGHHRPHQPGRAPSRPTAPPGTTCPSTASSARTSTPTARGAATTR